MKEAVTRLNLKKEKNHGSWNSVVDAGSASPDHYFARPVLALNENGE
jgi:hypothetical protein